MIPLPPITVKVLKTYSITLPLNFFTDFLSRASRRVTGLNQRYLYGIDGSRNDVTNEILESMLQAIMFHLRASYFVITQSQIIIEATYQNFLSTFQTFSLTVAFCDITAYKNSTQQLLSVLLHQFLRQKVPVSRFLSITSFENIKHNSF